MFVKDQMSPHPVTITPESSIMAAQRAMKDNNIRHLPVVGPSGGLQGLITRTSLAVGRATEMVGGSEGEVCGPGLPGERG